jgi:hypothetical protein
MIALKPLLICLLAGSSSAFAVQQPTQKVLSKSAALRMSGGADGPLDLKVRWDVLFSVKKFVARVLTKTFFEYCIFFQK